MLAGHGLAEVDAGTSRARPPFAGRLQPHGLLHIVEGQARVRHDGAKVQLEASFPVTLAAFGCAQPQYLGVGVKDNVGVKVSLVAAPASSAGGSR